MKIKHEEITIRELTKGYRDDEEEGVVGYGGKLNIRPPYQREFIYKDKQRDEVIRSVRKSFPLNSMYWAKNGETYELLDGQQRTISICQYVSNKFSIKNMYFDTLTDKEREDILDYKLMVYICDGEDRDKLEWFEIINIAGEKLTPQELRNAVYSGAWVTDAKRYFSKSGEGASQLAGAYLKGSPIRQEILQTIIAWKADEAGIEGKDPVAEYMAQNKNKESAEPLWEYCKAVFAWVEATYPDVAEYKKEMKGVDYGILYNEFKSNTPPAKEIADKVKKLMEDEDVTKKSGIFTYVLDGNPKHLSIRLFTDNQKREAYQKQKGVCPKCKEKFDIEDMAGDHKKPWSKGGKTTTDNLEMLCKPCNLEKSND